jgi:predicted nicotinamide N-methyase
MDEIPANFFISEEYKLFTETIGTYSQSFYVLPAASTDYDLTGQVLWPGAMQLAEYLLSNPSLIENEAILELGSGSGLCGLFCSQLASKTILTDGNDIVMKLLEMNLQFGRNVECLLVDWNDQDPGARLEENGLERKFRVIIGADVVYWTNSIVPLFNTVNELLSKDWKFYMCYTIRAMNTYRDLERLSRENGFTNQVLWQKENTIIYEFTRADS